MNFRQVGKKIKTIGNVKKITKAMQMVAAVKMRKAQMAAVAGQPYREILTNVISRVIEKSSSEFLDTNREDIEGQNLYIIISSNKGLCGSFNLNLLKQIVNEVDFKHSHFLTVGKKGAVLASKLGGTMVADFSENTPFIDNVSALFTLITEGYLGRKYNKIYLAYNHFVSTLKIFPVIEQLLPLSLEEILKLKQGNDSYLIEPNDDTIIESLLQDYIKEKISGSILESEAAFYSSQMMAMKNATDNAGEIIFNLNLLKNKLRQASITNELLDITTAKISAEN